MATGGLLIGDTFGLITHPEILKLQNYNLTGNTRLAQVLAKLGWIITVGV